MYYFQEDDRIMQALSDSENESDNVNQSDMTQWAKQAVQTKWKRHRTCYLMKGVAVCREEFIHVYGQESSYSFRCYTFLILSESYFIAS